MFSSNVCAPDQEERCKKQDGSEEVHRWACEKCGKQKRGEIQPYTDYLLHLRRLLKAGFPFHQDDLPFEVWDDVAMIDEIITLKTRIF